MGGGGNPFVNLQNITYTTGKQSETMKNEVTN